MAQCNINDEILHFNLSTDKKTEVCQSIELKHSNSDKLLNSDFNVSNSKDDSCVSPSETNLNIQRL
jgi:hypothetical protein